MVGVKSCHAAQAILSRIALMPMSKKRQIGSLPLHDLLSKLCDRALFNPMARPCTSMLGKGSRCWISPSEQGIVALNSQIITADECAGWCFSMMSSLANLSEAVVNLDGSWCPAMH